MSHSNLLTALHSYMKPWLETIIQHHEAEGLDIDIPLILLGICLIDNYDDGYHKQAIKIFMDSGGHEMVLKIIDS